MTSDWIAFYTTLAQISVGLAGLLFISFSIYFAGFTVDPLEMKIGTSYYIEVISAFFISLSAILPPHWWWLGAAGTSIFYIFYIIRFVSYIGIYRKEFDKFYDRRGNKKSEEAVPTQKAYIYNTYKLQCENNWIFWIRTILLLFCAIEGVISTIGVHIFVFIFSLDNVAVEITGFATASYLVSCVIGAWLFFLKFEDRNKNKDKFYPGSSERYDPTNR